MTPVEQLEALTIENATLRQNVESMEAAAKEHLAVCVERDELKMALETANQSVISLTAEIEAEKQKSEKLATDLTNLQAENQTLKDRMALKPGAFADVAPGAEPVKDGPPAADSKSPAACKAEYRRLLKNNATPAELAAYREQHAEQLGIKKKN